MYIYIWWINWRQQNTFVVKIVGLGLVTENTFQSKERQTCHQSTKTVIMCEKMALKQYLSGICKITNLLIQEHHKGICPLHSDSMICFSSHGNRTTASGPGMAVRSHHQYMLLHALGVIREIWHRLWIFCGDYTFGVLDLHPRGIRDSVYDQSKI